MPAEYLSLLSVQGEFGDIRCIPIFDDLVHVVATFDIKYSGIFVLLSVYITGILLTSK